MLRIEEAFVPIEHADVKYTQNFINNTSITVYQWKSDVTHIIKNKSFSNTDTKRKRYGCLFFFLIDFTES